MILAAALSLSCATSLALNPACRLWKSGATKPKNATCSGIAPEDLERFKALCERERCPFAVVGTMTED